MLPVQPTSISPQSRTVTGQIVFEGACFNERPNYGTPVVDVQQWGQGSLLSAIVSCTTVVCCGANDYCMRLSMLLGRELRASQAELGDPHS